MLGACDDEGLGSRPEALRLEGLTLGSILDAPGFITGHGGCGSSLAPNMRPYGLPAGYWQRRPAGYSIGWEYMRLEIIPYLRVDTSNLIPYIILRLERR